MSIVVGKFGRGILYSRALFVSVNKSSSLEMNLDGSLTMRRNDYMEMFIPKFGAMIIPIKRFGMDKNGIVVALSDSSIQYPMKIEYNTYNFNSGDVQATLMDDCSFGAFDTMGNLVYRAEFQGLEIKRPLSILRAFASDIKRM